MAESVEELALRLEAAIKAGFRGRLLDRGLARGLIWRDGQLPEDAPRFSASLTQDLLDYAYAVLSMTLRLRSLDPKRDLERPFLVAGEAIEAAVHRGEITPDTGFHRISSAIAFHLARYSARAYSMLPIGVEIPNLAPTEIALLYILRRQLNELHKLYSSWLLDDMHSDTQVAARLSEDNAFDDRDACSDILISSFMQAVALFDYALITGDTASAESARQQFDLTASTASHINAVSHWWTATLAKHLIDELWGLGMHNRIPMLPPDDMDGSSWEELRRDYIQRLRAGRRSAIELWPSQLTAVDRAINPTDDLVVALPTSAGKTRIAELCILRALAAKKRVIYITPLRALAAQIKADLEETFRPLGYAVSNLYGSAGVELGDATTLRQDTIVVSTPEKLDFALRNEPSLIDDVALIVLDEGHMLGLGEREVRYEALVQRLLRREDAASRRVVCLSALFPSPEDMEDLVGWIRQDEPGQPVHSTWRPTRQRFGTVRWTGDAARLDISVQDENPFVQRFVETQPPPESSRRKNNFPQTKNELTLATSWRFVEQGKDVLIYCALRKSVETLGKLVLQCIKQGVLEPLSLMTDSIRDVMATGAEWLGEDHPAVRCLEYGVVLHHAGLPRPFLNGIEHLLRSRACHLTIASPTLAQGLNLAASVLLVPSIWRNQETIPVSEFANVAGRAGRAFVDLEGLVLHIIWDRPDYSEKKWDQLVDKARAPMIQSGILLLVGHLFITISRTFNVPRNELVDYITGNSESWAFTQEMELEHEVTRTDWERDLASLDSAILALLEPDTDSKELLTTLQAVLEGSLFERQLGANDEIIQTLVLSFMASRAELIWSNTSEAQRRGFYAAGVGLDAGRFLDDNLVKLVELLIAAEAAIGSDDGDAAAIAILEFAALVFEVAPFRAPKALPYAWKEALVTWISGASSAAVIKCCGGDSVDLLQEAFMYRLPWAMEAVRVHSSAVSGEEMPEVTGLAALAVEAGSCHQSVIQLVRSGLDSREAAFRAIESTGANFVDRKGMLSWLRSDEVSARHPDPEWPSSGSRHLWVEFFDEQSRRQTSTWKRSTQKLDVEWDNDSPAAGTKVRLELLQESTAVMSPSMTLLGVCTSSLFRPIEYIVSAYVTDDTDGIEVEYFGLERGQ